MLEADPCLIPGCCILSLRKARGHSWTVRNNPWALLGVPEPSTYKGTRWEAYTLRVSPFKTNVGREEKRTSLNKSFPIGWCIIALSLETTWCSFILAGHRNNEGTFSEKPGSKWVQPEPGMSFGNGRRVPSPWKSCEIDWSQDQIERKRNVTNNFPHETSKWNFQIFALMTKIERTVTQIKGAQHPRNRWPQRRAERQMEKEEWCQFWTGTCVCFCMCVCMYCGGTREETIKKGREWMTVTVAVRESEWESKSEKKVSNKWEQESKQVRGKEGEEEILGLKNSSIDWDILGMPASQNQHFPTPSTTRCSPQTRTNRVFLIWVSYRGFLQQQSLCLNLTGMEWVWVTVSKQAAV